MRSLLLFGGGVAVGLLFADWYAQHKTTGAVDSLLGVFGLGGGKVQQAADQLVPTLVG